MAAPPSDLQNAARRLRQVPWELDATELAKARLL
jgi:hypothetical protein